MRLALACAFVAMVLCDATRSFADDPVNAAKSVLCVRNADTIYQFGFTPDSQSLLTTWTRRDEKKKAVNEFLVWDIATGQSKKFSDRHALLAAVSPDQKTLLLYVEENPIDEPNALWEFAVWDLEKQKEVRRVRVGRNVCGISPDGSLIITYERPKEGKPALALWDAATGKQRIQFEDASARFAFAPDGKSIALLGPNHLISICDTEKGKLIGTYRRPATISDDRIQAFAFTPDGKTLAVAVTTDELIGLPYAVVFWDVATRKHSVRFRREGTYVYNVAFSPDGNRLVIGTSGRGAEVWDLRRDRLEMTLGEDKSAQGVVFSPDGQYLAVRFSRPTVDVCVWKLPPLKKDE